MDLAASSAVVTGGASGLGVATARAMAARGMRVVVLDLSDQFGFAVADEIGGSYVSADVSDSVQVAAGVAAAQDLAPLRVLVNCAEIGSATRTIGPDCRFESAHPLDSFRKVIEVNLIGSFNCARIVATATSTTEPDDDGQRGVIIDTSSSAASDAQIGQVAYSAPKGGIVGMTLPLVRDLAVVGIRVNTIAPGSSRRRSTTRSRTPRRRRPSARSPPCSRNDSAGLRKLPRSPWRSSRTGT